MKKTLTVNPENVPDEYRPLVKDEMTYQEVATLGTVLLKDKFARMKIKLFGWYYDRKREREK